MQALEIRGLSFRFAPGFAWILNGIDLDVAQGEVLGVMGPNGSGKTTLLRLISSYLKPSRGWVRVFDRDLSRFKIKELARIMAVVPQEGSLLFPFTCLEIVLLGRTPYQRGFGFDTQEDVRVAEEALRLTDTLYLKDRLINEISGGERQRVLIARALAQSPRLLLMDEPTTFLDLRHRKESFDLISRLNKGMGITVVVVSHDIDLVAAYCHRVLLLKDGAIYKIGPPDDVITRKNIEAVYNCPVLVDENPTSGTPRVSLELSEVRRERWE